MNRNLHERDPCICPMNNTFCGRNHENGPGPMRSQGSGERERDQGGVLGNESLRRR